MIDPNALKVTELKAELTSRGLSTKGLKKELVTRLEEALAAEESSTSAPETPMDTDNATQEAEQIAQIVEPVQEPVAAAAESDIVMAAVPTPDESVSASAGGDVLSSVEVATSILEPVIGTPTLSQEGMVDTTTTPATDATSTSTASTSTNTASVESSKKRSLEADDTVPNDSFKRTRQDSGAEDNARIKAAAAEAVEAGARRRSAAPSPSPAPGRSASAASVASVASVATIGEENTTPGSPDRKTASATNPRRIDARSLMERQIKMAVQDRQPEATSQSPVESKSAPILQPVTEDADGETDSSAEATRSLVISNFVRPLTVNQVKRMLAEFGEIEVLWMDSIRTHCYVTYKAVESAASAFKEVVGQVFPKETGKALQAMYLSPETAAQCVETAEDAQKNGRRPVIYTGEAVSPAPKHGGPIAVRNDEVEVIFKRTQAESAQVVQPTDLFKMTTAQPALYYKSLKEPPVETPSETVN